MKQLSLQNKISIIIISMIIIPLFITASLSIVVNKSLYINKTAKINSALLTSINNEINRKFIQTENSLASLITNGYVKKIIRKNYKSNPKGKSEDNRLIIELMQSMLTSQTDLIASVSLYGYTTENFFQRGIAYYESDFRQKEWASEVIEKPNIFIYKPANTIIDGHYKSDLSIININRAEIDRETGSPHMIIRAFLFTKAFHNLMKTALYGKRSYVALMDSHGQYKDDSEKTKNYLILTDDNPKYTFYKDIISMDTLQESQFYTKKIGSSEYIVTCAQFENASCSLISVIPTRNFSGESTTFTLIILTVIIFMFGISILIGWKLFNKNLFKPLSRLLNIANGIKNTVLTGNDKDVAINNITNKNPGSNKSLSFDSNQVEWEQLKSILLNLEIELKNSHETVCKIQNIDIIGKLAAGISHDFNNILSGIAGTISLIDLKIKHQTVIQSKTLKEYFYLIKTSVNRASGIVKQLLSISTENSNFKGIIDLSEVISIVIKLFSFSFDKRIKFLLDIQVDKAIIWGDNTRLEQMLLNLCINAGHAMTIMRNKKSDWGGTLTITLSEYKSEEMFKKLNNTIQDRFWLIRLSDSGVGMSNETLEKIFTPFFTTKDRKIGTGLGLLMVQRIIDEHNGFIEVTSNEGIGTDFEIYLPVYNTHEEIKKETDHPNKALNTGTVILCDDEDIIRYTYRLLLEDAGYEVLEAADEKQFFECYTNDSTVKCIVLDYSLGKSSGLTILKKLRKQNQSTGVILTSGIELESNEEIDNDSRSCFLLKPFTIEILIHTIEDIS